MSEATQGMRDGSFGPLKSGQNDIQMITEGVKFFSKGSALLAHGKLGIQLDIKYIYLTEPLKSKKFKSRIFESS